MNILIFLLWKVFPGKLTEVERRAPERISPARSVPEVQTVGLFVVHSSLT
jgi:hypothetical protein